MGKSTNAGAHNAIGIEFQKHCALYLLFHNYSTLRSIQYFVCIEHHDDVLFCHEGQTGDIELINSYQSKKSSNPWGLSNDFYEVLAKMAGTGRDLTLDTAKKSVGYTHNLNFATNNSISMVIKKTKTTPSISYTVNDSNTIVSFGQLPLEIRDRITSKIKAYWKSDQGPLPHIDYITLRFVDLPRNSQNQLDMLKSGFIRLVNPEIADASAAVTMLLSLFREVETTLNNGSVSKLMDPSKRVHSDQINKALDIIDNQQKAYNLWRHEGKDLSKKLQIPIADGLSFGKAIADSFDLFKDKKQTEHRTILKYVEDNSFLFRKHFEEVECILELYEGYCAQKNSPLTPILLKAAITAAYIQIKETL